MGIESPRANSSSESFLLAGLFPCDLILAAARWCPVKALKFYKSNCAWGLGEADSTTGYGTFFDKVGVSSRFLKVILLEPVSKF